MGNLLEFHCAILSLLKSTTVTFMSGHFKAITLQVGPPTYPAPKQQIFLITIMYLAGTSVEIEQYVNNGNENNDNKNDQKCIKFDLLTYYQSA